MTPTYKKRKQAGGTGGHWEKFLVGAKTAALSTVNPVSQRLSDGLVPICVTTTGAAHFVTVAFSYQILS